MAARSIDKDEKAKRIIEHATAVFAKKGYNAATIEDIAVKAKIAKGTVYQYFKSKQDLFLAVFNAYMEQYFESSVGRTATTNRTVAEQIREGCRELLRQGKDAMYLFPLVFEFWAASALPDTRDKVREIFRRFYAIARGWLGGLIRQGIDRGEFRDDIDVEAAAAVLVGSFDGLFLQTWFDPDMDLERAGMEFLEIFLRGAQKGNER